MARPPEARKWTERSISSIPTAGNSLPTSWSLFLPFQVTQSSPAPIWQFKRNSWSLLRANNTPPRDDSLLYRVIHLKLHFISHCPSKHGQEVRFYILTAVTMKITVHWDVTSCILFDISRFGRICCLHYLPRRWRQQILTKRRYLSARLQTYK
jgi:hypothetical protein